MLLPERDHDAVVRRCRLQLEIESPAEPLPQRKTPRAVDARAKGSVQHKLHSTTFIKEAFRNDLPLSRKRAECRDAGTHIERCLFRPAAIQGALSHEPFDGIFRLRDRFSDIRDLVGEFDRPPGRLSSPERN